MKARLMTCALLVAPFLTSCLFGIGDINDDSSDELESSEIDTSISSELIDDIPATPETDDNLPKPPMPEYTDFWNFESEVSFIFEIDPVHIQNISDCGADKDDWRNELYFPITLHLSVNDDDYTIYEVGMRQKGNTSRHNFAEEGLITSALPGFKLAFNLTWDEDYYEDYGIRKTWQNDEPEYEARQARRLFDMERLDFKYNRSTDTSIVGQPFIYNLFAWGGDIITPQSSLAGIKIINSEQEVDVGVYTINEPIDKTLIRRYFSKPESQGDLYKCLWPTDFRILDVWGRPTITWDSTKYVADPGMIGVENGFENYHPTYDLKTNRKTSDHSHLVNFIQTLNECMSLGQTEMMAALEAIIDMNSFLKFAAISYLVGNPDDLRMNVNNLYLYFHPVTNKVYFIPYDNDWALGIAWNDWLGLEVARQHPHYYISLVATNNDSSPQWQRNPLYWYTICQEDDPNQIYSETYPLVTSYRDSYDQFVTQFINSTAFSFSTYNNYFQTYKNTYELYENDIEQVHYFQDMNIFTDYFIVINETVTNAYA